MADAKVLVVGRGSLSVSPTPSPVTAEVYAVGRGILLLPLQRTAEAMQITPNDPDDPTRDYFTDETELLAYPTGGLVVGDWANILSDDGRSQTFFGANWNGSTWDTAFLYEQGVVATGDQEQNRIQVNPPGQRYPTIFGIHTGKDNPGLLRFGTQASGGATALIPAFDTAEGIAYLALSPGGGLPGVAVLFEDVDGIFQVGDTSLQGRIRMTERTTPATDPPLGRWELYPKTDGWYALDDAGVETGPFGTGGGGGGVDVEDEGVPEGTADTIDFVGAGVSVAFAAGTATVTISGGGGGGGDSLLGWLGL